MTTQETKTMVFIDSNIVLYALGNDEEKKTIASNLLTALPAPYISTQVINECSHVLRRKSKRLPAQVKKDLSAIITLTHLLEFSINEIYIAWRLSERYRYSHYDSLILATALTNNCKALYSEDMQHKQIIDNQLTIINPFINE
jgi:predicted nucleic acid-binding protein